MNNKRILKILGVVLFAGLLVAGSVIGYVLGYAQGVGSEQAQWQSGDWSKFDQLLYSIEQYYVEDTDREDLIEGALHGLVEGLDDDYSQYLNAEEWQDVLIQSGGAYSGIGVEVTIENSRVTVIAPFAGSPAEEAGLLPGDQIVEVDGISIEGMSLDEAVQGIRGEEGEELTLGIVREGLSNVFRVTLERATIERESVETEMLSTDIGYLALSQFTDTSDDEFSQGIRDLQTQGMEGLVLDLRDNPGGYLDTVVEIARQIVPQSVIVYTEDRHGNRIEEFSSALRQRGYPMVVLANEYSASASEILAGALQDNDVPVIGTTTYGKGTVQRFYSLNDGTYLKLTMAKFFTPGGKEIQDNGVTPDYAVEMDSINRMPTLPHLGTLELGSEALHVYQLQNMLTALDYLSSPATGVYDQATVDAVGKLQVDAGLPPSGQLDSQANAALNQRWVDYTRQADVQLSKAMDVLAQLLQQD